MNRGTWTAVVLALGWALLAAPAPAWADIPAAPNAGTPEAVAAARAHFTKGRDLYQAGSYHEAIAELEAARALDPKAKDLVFNLGIVHEKLGEIDEALHYLRLYVQMDLDPAEHTKAENYIKRLEGAKAEIDAKKSAEVLPSEGEHTKPPVRVRGRFDAATVVTGAVAVGAVGVGFVFGVKALADQPKGFVTGQDGTVQTLDSRQRTAHTEAVVADVSFGGALVATGVALGLYFGRFKDPAAPSRAKAASIYLAPSVRAGGSRALVFGGTF